jgi:hypothetical protein
VPLLILYSGMEERILLIFGTILTDRKLGTTIPIMEEV